MGTRLYCDRRAAMGVDGRAWRRRPKRAVRRARQEPPAVPAADPAGAVWAGRPRVRARGRSRQRGTEPKVEDHRAPTQGFFSDAVERPGERYETGYALGARDGHAAALQAGTDGD